MWSAARPSTSPATPLSALPAGLSTELRSSCLTCGSGMVDSWNGRWCFFEALPQLAFCLNHFSMPLALSDLFRCVSACLILGAFDGTCSSALLLSVCVAYRCHLESANNLVFPEVWLHSSHHRLWTRFLDGFACIICIPPSPPF